MERMIVDDGGDKRCVLPAIEGLMGPALGADQVCVWSGAPLAFC